jgi:Spy/CpxP family protein refolding chaperone
MTNSIGWKPGGKPLLAVLVLPVALVAGIIAGVAADRTLLIPRVHRGFARGPHGPLRDRESRDRFARDRFAQDVGLTPEQQTKVDSIMDQQGRELRAVRGQVQPQLDSIITRIRRALDSVLTPEQGRSNPETASTSARTPAW